MTGVQTCALPIYLGFQKFLKRIGVAHSDPIKIAGGAKCLASPELETDRTFVLEQIRTSMRLHNTKRVILMLHSDCGAYGGLPAFGGNAETEATHHRRELARAAANLLGAIPGVEVQGYFVDFDGIWDAEIDPEIDTRSGIAEETEVATVA